VLLLLLRPAGFFRLVRQRVDTVLLGATLRVCMCTCLRVCAIWARDRGPATARRAAAAPHGRARPRAGSAFLLWLATLVPGVAAVLHMREVPCSGAAAATPPGA
jgi:hypothetical protein